MASTKNKEKNYREQSPLTTRDAMENGDLPQENGQSTPLADFVTRNYEEQREARQRVGEAHEDQRVDAFLQRALSESKRMDAEVSKAERRQNELYRELGQDKMHSWIMEHASEVTVTLPTGDRTPMDTEDVSKPSDKTDAIR